MTDEELPPAPDPTTHVMVCPYCKDWQVDAHPRARRHLGGPGKLWAMVGHEHLEHVRVEHAAKYAATLGARRRLQVAQVPFPRWWVWR